MAAAVWRPRRRGNRLISSSRKTATQLGSRPTTGMPAWICGRRASRMSRSKAFGRVEHAEVVQRPAAAQRALAGTQTWKPAASSTSTAAWAISGWKWLLNVSGQRITGGSSGLRGWRPRNQALKVCRAKGGMRRCWAMPPTHLATSLRTGVWLKKLARPGSQRRQPRPPVDPAHGVGVARPQPTFVVVRQKLGLVGGHVHVDRAVALAALAGQAQVERVLDRFAFPAVGQHFAVHHLEQQAGPAARAMLLLAGDLIAGAHDLAALAAAVADADAAQRRPGETSCWSSAKWKWVFGCGGL